MEESSDAEIKEKVSKKRGRGESETAQRMAKFKRGAAVATRAIADKKLKGQLRHSEKLAAEAAYKAAKAEQWLLPEEAGTLEAEGLERTWRFSQEEIVREAETGAAQKVFDLDLPELGPYNLGFTRSGRHMLLGGRKGHLAIMEWQQRHLVCEVQVRETVRDATFLHNEQFFAAAQKKYVYIYDKRGLEVHCLKEHTGVRRLEFLPYHFLLASIGEGGVLRYQDTSTGQIIAQHRTKMGTCDAMRQNPWNGVMQLGHANGVVSMWTPNVTTAVVKMLCHRGPVRAIATDTQGQHMVTAGADGQVKVWDVRKLQPMHSYFSRAPADTLDISQRGMLAVGFGRNVQVWKDALAQKQESPYMRHTLPSGVLRDFQFCPYEDVLAVGHSGGVSTMLVPGAGEPHYDSRVADPFQGRKARREQEVAHLMDKLQPDMIVLDPSTIAQARSVRKEPKDVAEERKAEAAAANASRRKEQEEKNEGKKRMKGKNKPSRRQKKKQANIIEARAAPAGKPELRQRMREQGVLSGGGAEKKQPAPIPEDVPRALHRFYKKGVQ
ncbi:WD40 repeat-like protein [Coccomyxa subellipsoidea C-169]|uniref:WD40 repeat-like protein n=1 Tax=Coccomyxa subellipsoidea (strain C-169) TaxID=574566 RepID=I0Z6X2_COCSC|nr:WD40 repeat-like protein [Coccomyxa subellipsoidea C-169]EIE26391.1 WD40 repeat-like protein [Coccomyxa subellipsoidea C-169]|eukprot:XP_005650935.1 WD40 repeat-like protein [Coccomyxa subellipsoidea C-169]